MVHHHHHHRYYPQAQAQLKKGEVVISGFVQVDDNGSARIKKARPSLVFLLFLSFVSFWTCHHFAYTPSFSLLYSPVAADTQELLCSSVSNGSICCDRSSHRTDICFMKGDVRTHSGSSSIFLSNPKHQRIEEKIRPYTRKWETSVMSTIDELKLVSTDSEPHKCDVYHHVPAVFFSTGGYTGNVYHEFNDGIIPLYITSQRFNNKVVFVILDYHNWWQMKYGNILSHLSDYPPIDFNGDKRSHCFPEAIVGLRIHDELTVDSSLMQANKTVRDFRTLLDRAYWPRIEGILQEEKRKELSLSPNSYHKVDALWKPKLVILSRNGSRSITNEGLVVKMAQKVGFRVQVVKPDRTTELAKIYQWMNSSDVMMGVHGAAMTHFLFMKPGSVFIQVIPLGTEWAAATYYGEPAVKLGLKYIGYKILPKESSLYTHYDKDDPVLRDPNSVVKKGWQYTKKIYLENQTIQINLNRFNKRLLRAYDYCISKRAQVAAH